MSQFDEYDEIASIKKTQLTLAQTVVIRNHKHNLTQYDIMTSACHKWTFFVAKNDHWTDSSIRYDYEREKSVAYVSIEWKSTYVNTMLSLVLTDNNKFRTKKIIS